MKLTLVLLAMLASPIDVVLVFAFVMMVRGFILNLA